MIGFNINRIFIAEQPVDMRKSFNTLAQIVETDFEENPHSGDAFVFIGKQKNRLKVLWWENSGYWIFNKRLEQGRFALPFMKSTIGDTCVHEMTPSQWQMLLEGIIPIKLMQKKRYKGLPN